MAETSPLHEAAVGLREVILAGENYRQVVARHLGLTVSESRAVSFLFSRGAMGQGELGQSMGFNTSSTTALVDRLERNSIAERVPDPADRRRSTIRLSDAGRKTFASATGWMTHAFDHIAPADLLSLAASLHSVARDLRAEIAKVPTEPSPMHPAKRGRSR